MKKLINIQKVYQIEINISDDLLSEESIENFESYIFPISSEDKIDALFEYTAENIINDQTFIEGLSEASSYSESTNTLIKYKIIDEYTEIL